MAAKANLNDDGNEQDDKEKKITPLFIEKTVNDTINSLKEGLRNPANVLVRPRIALLAAAQTDVYLIDEHLDTLPEQNGIER